VAASPARASRSKKRIDVSFFSSYKRRSRGVAQRAEISFAPTMGDPSSPEEERFVTIGLDMDLPVWID
jgi:hypothetical protein